MTQQTMSNENEIKYNTGQNVALWTSEWNNLTPTSEIQMWDYYGLRQWILKYTPREGKVLEAGCGLGRHVFYLSQFGIDIEGIDFSNQTILFLNKWKNEHGFNSIDFKTGNVLALPYSDNSLSGYLSFGVVEHFLEGPQAALKEAHRVLRPGGIAIVSTPSNSFHVLRIKLIRKLRNLVRKLSGLPIKPSPFFQYWFSASQLKDYVDRAGLKVMRYDNADLLFAFMQHHSYQIDKIQPGTLAYKLANRLENTLIRRYGAQSIVIAVKSASQMHCFMCGKLSASHESLKVYDVPICKQCESVSVSKYYRKSRRVKYEGKYSIDPPYHNITRQKCIYCHSQYMSSALFENYGFSQFVCPNCLRKKVYNIELSNKYVKPIWRKKKQGCSVC